MIRTPSARPEPPSARVVIRCRGCGSDALETVLDLGSTPLANALVTDPEEGSPEPRYPLAVAFCPACTLLQTTHFVPGELIFGADYPYFSSYSPVYLRHAEVNARELISSRRLGGDSFVIEIGSNDGYLLKHFVAEGIPVLGIDPAQGPAAAAEAIGVPTLTSPFTLDLARQLRREGKCPDVFVGNNVLAHVNDLNDVIAGLALILAEDGVAVFEVPYLVDLVEKCAFDTIYHEHNCYFSLTALAQLFNRHGLEITDVRRLSIHGGSIRVFVGKGGERGSAVEEMLAAERELGIHTAGYYRHFARRVDEIVAALRELLLGLKAKGNRLAAYGAAAKGATLANVAGLDRRVIEYVVDRNPNKQGLFMPGVHIPIVAPERLFEDAPDYLLLFAWNFADGIRAQLEDFPGRFVTPIPQPRIL